MFYVRWQFRKVFVQTECETPAYLVALFFPWKTGDCTVEGGRGRYYEASKIVQASWGKYVNLYARRRCLGSGRRGSVEDEDRRAGKKLIGGIEER